MNEFAAENQEVSAKRFEWSVRAICQPAHVQSQLFPDFVCVAEELALEFEEWHRRFRCAGASERMTPGQFQLVEEIDAQLMRMSGGDHDELWTDDALANSEEWKKIREAAETLVREMKWSNSPPPIDRGDKFVQG